MRIVSTQRIAVRFVSELWAPVLVFGLWQLWVCSAGYNRIVLVAPTAVLADLVSAPLAYLAPSLHTLGFALLGLALGMAGGLLLAVAAWASELLNGLTTPVALLVSSTPVVCLIPILARLFGYTSLTEFVTVAVMSFFPSFVYAAAGMRSPPPRTPAIFAVWRASRLQRLRLLALPSAVPSLAVALRVGATYSVLVALLSEYLMQTGGLGTMIAVTMQQFHLARALGASLVAMALSGFLYALSHRLEHSVLRRYKPGD